MLGLLIRAKATKANKTKRLRDSRKTQKLCRTEKVVWSATEISYAPSKFYRHTSITTDYLIGILTKSQWGKRKGERSV